METAPLKSFATWARTSLIREVNARIAAVLAPASPERVERPSAVAALERAVTDAGGDAAGRAAVADKVAYTWFNRLIALRFMDANGYTGIGVVSPPHGAVGQPEILAEAKRGNIDNAVVSRRTLDTVTGLLNGTRRSDDAQGEAYALLLAEYCRHWNRAMPFMFEREGDYTELLIPADLLAHDSVLARSVTVLTPDVCKDVEVIGWLYQFYISERKDEVFAGFRKHKKAGAAEIPAATQLFTPHWIVRYLVENSLGRLWMLNRPTSRLVEQMDYYIAPVDQEADFARVSSPEELKIIDPACGSGHMLTYAFDLLYAIYQEEGYAPTDIPQLILANNLYGVEIDPRAGALAAFALTMKGRARQRTFFNMQVSPRVCVLEPIHFDQDELNIITTSGGRRFDEELFWNAFQHADTFGALIQPRGELIVPLERQIAEHPPADGDMLAWLVFSKARRVLEQSMFLAQHYNVVVANPPYMGAKSMDARLTEFAKAHYGTSKSDLFAMFLERALLLSRDRGYVAMITMHTWLFLSTYEVLRAAVLTSSSPVALAHLGTRAFDSIGGEVVSTAAFILEKGGSSEHKAHFVRLNGFESESTKNSALLAGIRRSVDGILTFQRDARYFLALPGQPFAFWLDDALARAFESDETLRTVLRPKIGMRTGNNDRFLRRWFEVSFSDIAQDMEDRGQARQSLKRWFPYNKGGGLRRWYGNQEYVVDWLDDGGQIKAETLMKYPQLSVDNLGWKISNENWYFKESLTWSDITTTGFAARFSPPGFIFDVKGSSGFPLPGLEGVLLALLNSRIVHEYMVAINPSTTLQVGDIAKIPFVTPMHEDLAHITENTRELVELAKADWDAFELSWGFNGLLSARDLMQRPRLMQWIESVRARWERSSQTVRGLELENEEILNRAYSYAPRHADSRFEYSRLENADRTASELLRDLVSYSVGCMFGRYSLDEPGLILADQGATLQDFLARIPAPTFMPDLDNVIPIFDGDWFEDDIVARFRTFLRVAFGEQYFEENLRFVTETLGVRDLRDYFVKSFYKDHVQRYKKRPIYWLFSSPKGSFNALIYMHRYTPSTVSTVLNEYLREYKAKLEASRQHHERLAAGAATPRERAVAQKEADRLRNVLLELDEYEHDVLYPLATRQIRIDLDDGVKANYPKFGAALKKIPGLEVGDE